MADVFISYSRKDKEFANRLVNALEKDKRDVWVDWEDIPPGEQWLNEIKTGIENAHSFVLIVTRNSLISEICNLEINHARSQNKRIIPVMRQAIEGETLDLVKGQWFGKDWQDVANDNWTALRHINWIFADNDTEFDKVITDIIATVEADFGHVKQHTRYQVRAIEWQRANENPSFLLTGDELVPAEIWLAKAEEKSPAPSELQSRFITSSRLAEKRRTRRSRLLNIALGIFSIVTLALLVVTLIQTALVQTARKEAEQSLEAEQSALAAEAEARQQAEANAIESRARELAASSILYAEDFPDRAMLLSLESLAVQDTYEGRNALLISLLEQSRLSRYFFGSDAYIRAVEISQFGQFLAVGTNQGSIIIYDRIANIVTHELAGGVERVTALSFSPDSRWLVSGDGFGRVIIWDTITGNMFQDVGINDAEIRTLSFSPDGTMLVAGNSQSEIIKWSIDSSDVEWESTITAHETRDGTIFDLAFSPDGTMMASGGSDNTIHLWNNDGESLALMRVIEGHTNWVSTLEFSPDGQYLASGSFDRSIRVWIVATGEPYWAFIGHSQEVAALTYNNIGNILISSDLDGNIVFWNALDTSENLIMNFRTFPPFEVRALDSYSNELYVGGDHEALLALNIGYVPRFGTTLNNITAEIWTTAINVDGSIAYSGGSDRDFPVYILPPNNSEVITLNLHTNFVTGLTWHTNHLISAGIDGQVAIWSGEELVDVINIGVPVFDVAAYDNLIALALNNGSIQLWDISGEPESWILVHTLEGHRNRVNAVDFSRDGSRLASGSLDTTIILWDVVTGEIIGQPLMGHNDSVETVRFSPDGDIIASGSRDTNIILWNAETGEQSAPPLTTHENWVNDIAFSPTGQMMVSVSNDRSVILWSVDEQRTLGLPFIGHIDWVNSVSFSGDDSYIITGGRDGQVIRWETGLDSWGDAACTIANRSFSPGEIRDFFDENNQPLEPCNNLSLLISR